MHKYLTHLCGIRAQPLIEVLYHFECNNMIEMWKRITSDFYPRLLIVWIQILSTFSCYMYHVVY